MRNPFTWAASLIDSGYSVQEALRKVSEVWVGDFNLEVAAGRVSGTSHINKFGRNPTVGTSSTEIIWDGSTTYTWPTSASITHIWSAVDSAITRGVDVEIQGLDTNWALVNQTVTTDASDSTTEVALGTALRRVFRMKVHDDTLMDQNLRVGPTGKGSFQAQVTAGYNQTLMAIYTVPAGKTGYLTEFYASINKITGGGDPEGNVELWMRDNTNGYAPRIQNTQGLVYSGSSQFEHTFMPYPSYPEKTDLWLQLENLSGTAVCDAEGGFDIILES